MGDGYRYGSTDLTALLIARHYPERTDRETPIIHGFLAAHGTEYDAYEFSVHVGQGVAPDPAHLPGIQAATKRSTQKRIDMIVWKGPRPTIIEVKERITPSCLGQLLAYRHLLLEDRPDIEVPALAAIGRYSDDDTLRVLTAQGVDVYTYD